ncbi:translation elongation factor Ts [Maricaulis maris]|uniref:Elongation factor Ts n=1 Tax=Maricaulis maris TaxID=74318 RepID=A0A495DJD0_9PROT|nr:translation elongation factor Ts [Maricaulis maris]RKR02739.1 translation elongation factor Ts (EF-Ts) [Maricaulis maris]
MAAITAALVKELREKTGVGMMDCKKALSENDGDFEAAVDWLRKKGLSKAAKKADRVAAEGLVAVATDGGKGAVVEVNSETDFVARNEKFQATVKGIASLAIGGSGDVAEIKASSLASGSTVEDHLTNLIATIGENMALRRAAVVTAEPGVVASYVHNPAVADMGAIGVLVGLKSDGDKDKLAELGRKIAMHVAAGSPAVAVSVDVDGVDSAIADKEREVFADQARQSGKPEAIVEKMVEGRMRKFYEEVVLLKQAFVMDPDSTIEQVLEAAAKDVGAPVTISGFVRMALGEGVEKGPEEDFAAEVAAASGQS